MESRKAARSKAVASPPAPDFDNLTSTPEGLDTQRMLTFCFTRVSCDIQIRQLINDIKCASASADCVTLCHFYFILFLFIIIYYYFATQNKLQGKIEKIINN